METAHPAHSQAAILDKYVANRISQWPVVINAFGPRTRRCGSKESYIGPRPFRPQRHELAARAEYLNAIEILDPLRPGRPRAGSAGRLALPMGLAGRDRSVWLERRWYRDTGKCRCPTGLW